MLSAVQELAPIGTQPRIATPLETVGRPEPFPPVKNEAPLPIETSRGLTASTVASRTAVLPTAVALQLAAGPTAQVLGLRQGRAKGPLVGPVVVEPTLGRP